MTTEQQEPLQADEIAEFLADLDASEARWEAYINECARSDVLDKHFLGAAWESLQLVFIDLRLAVLQ